MRARQPTLTSPKDGGLGSRNADGSRGPHKYFVGIIDILQQYTASKRAEVYPPARRPAPPRPAPPRPAPPAPAPTRPDPTRRRRESVLRGLLTLPPGSLSGRV